jgi:tetraacyldisaccharide 4'-kinase
MHVAILSRGYGRKDTSAIVVVSDGRAVLADSKAGGDEPALIATKLPGVPVVVGSDRYRAGLVAGKAFSPDTLILDDGFQHVRLQRDLDIVLVDAADPFGNGKLFPAGILREPLSALERADVVLITRSDEAGERTGPLKERIRRYTKAPVFSSVHRPLDLVNTTTGEIKPLSALRALQILAFSGIARPALFTSLLASLGAEVMAAMVYADHYAYRQADVEALFQKAAEVKAAMIITTEKDAARLKPLKRGAVWALRIELHVDDSNNSEWERMIVSG